MTTIARTSAEQYANYQALPWQAQHAFYFIASDRFPGTKIAEPADYATAEAASEEHGVAYEEMIAAATHDLAIAEYERANDC